MNAPSVKHKEEAWRSAVFDGTAKARTHRDELARRIRSIRAVTVANDPNRTYRAKAQECRRANKGYARVFGLGKAPKEVVRSAP